MKFVHDKFKIMRIESIEKIYLSAIKDSNILKIDPIQFKNV